MKTLYKIAVSGISLLGLAGAIDSCNVAREYHEEREQIPNLNAVVRYYDIENKMNENIPAGIIFNPEAAKRYSGLRREQDSLASIEGFSSSKKKYDLIKSNLRENNDISLAYSLIFALFGGVGAINFLSDWSEKRRKENKSK